VRILLWQVHGAWDSNFLQPEHEYVIGPEADGSSQLLPNWVDLPNVHAWSADSGRPDVDVVLLQREIELGLAGQVGLQPGVDIPAVYVEHNAPTGSAATSQHFLADQEAIPIVHVTAFNALMWDSGRASVHVIEHGVPDPQVRATAELPAAAVVINEPVRRGRITGTDLLPLFARSTPVDVFGIDAHLLASHFGNGSLQLTAQSGLTQPEVHAAMARRRVYLHPHRWTSLGLSLIEAMMLGLPVVVAATTAAPTAVAPGCGVVSADMNTLQEAVARFVANPQAALETGAVAREWALRRFSLRTFHQAWNQLLADVLAGPSSNGSTPASAHELGPATKA
jgi:glycosyltransferase involved in cell wall biosynthesis